MNEGSRTRVTLWIDADAAPQVVKEICFRASDRLKLDTVLVANQRVLIPAGYLHLSTVRVDGGPDAADRYIAEHAQAGDVAVTQDIPLAALLVPEGVAVIDPRGGVFTAESIGERLSVRNFMDGLRSSGVDTGGHGVYGSRERQAFANALDRAITRALKGRQ
ncbi:MAG TPA: YaiI/YqxD family protein [Gemmatimonadaceae bacterium]